MSDNEQVRREIASAMAASSEALIEASRRLVAAASPNPPGDVAAAAAAATDLLGAIPNVAIRRYEPAPGIVNLVARISSGKPGRRLIFNGHLDTFPIGEDLGWTVPPLGGTLRHGRLYGRGVSDMKAGIAASIRAAAVLAGHRKAWAGEIVLTLAGDEESMGQFGTQWLLDNVPEASGDAMICGDVGSPLVVRFGEKGLLWIEIEASGSPAHGAHVHKGVNAIDRLRTALDVLKRLEDITPVAPPEIMAAIAAAKSVSEPLSGDGENRVLQQVTVNIGTIEGGVSPNLVPSFARAKADIRIPVGVGLDDIRARLLSGLTNDGISWRIIQSYEPRFTAPDHEIVRTTIAAAAQVMGQRPVANMRIGASDARLYRLAGVPSVVFGCTPHGMGAPDEHVVVDELVKVATVHALTAFDFLTSGTENFNDS
jgi:acetylornithine deacetylase/succinyl-diaminopimelate desuccinylase-like protein